MIEAIFICNLMDFSVRMQNKIIILLYKFREILKAIFVFLIFRTFLIERYKFFVFVMLVSECFMTYNNDNQLLAIRNWEISTTENNKIFLENMQTQQTIMEITLLNNVLLSFGVFNMNSPIFKTFLFDIMTNHVDNYQVKINLLFCK